MYDLARIRPTASTTLSKAVTRAAHHLQIEQNQLARILGISTSTAVRLISGDYNLNPTRSEWKLSVLFLRIFRLLDSRLGHDESARAWLNSANRALEHTPAELLASEEGMLRVLNYLTIFDR